MDTVMVGPFDNANHSAPMLRLPMEIFHQIASYLPPVWLFSLSYTCQSFRSNLSFESGNKVWYNTLPPALWTAAEAFQNEAELSRAIESRDSTAQATSQLVKESYYRHRQSIHLTSPSTSYDSGPYPSKKRLISFGPTTLKSLHHHSESPASIYETFLQGLDSIPTSKYPRQRKVIIGGTYDPVFNYRREIHGHLLLRTKCHICLAKKDSSGLPVSIYHWGALFCDSCSADYTITLRSLSRIPNLADMLGDFKRWPQSGAQNNSKDDSMLFFRPFVDELLSSHTGLNISMNFLMIGRKEHEKQMERQLKKLPWTRQHSSRRAVRLEIIAAAEKIWQGIDPFPKEIIDVDTGRIMFERNSAMPADDPYRIYRDRFAPTHKLKEFLFAPAALAENSWEAVYDGTKDWLNDPTTKLRTRADYQNVRPKWIFDNAMMMLNCLTLWRVVRYHRKGYGGAVTNWVEAAVNWHITRMESELRSGSIIRKDHIPPAMKDGHPLPGLFDVREKLGLGVLLDNTTKSLPQQPQRGLTLTCQDYESFNAQERIAAREFHQQVESIKQFNKIVQHTCVRCPLSGWLFYPMGLEGMLAHVRSDHPGLFWEGEPHVLA